MVFPHFLLYRCTYGSSYQTRPYWKSETSVCTSDAAKPNAAMLVHTWCLNLLPIRDSRSGKKNLLKEKVLKQLVSDRGWADIAAPRPTSKKNGLWIMQSESIESRIENIALDASVAVPPLHESFCFLANSNDKCERQMWVDRSKYQ